jgi:hypothetical protein
MFFFVILSNVLVLEWVEDGLLFKSLSSATEFFLSWPKNDHFGHFNQ